MVGFANALWSIDETSWNHVGSSRTGEYIRKTVSDVMVYMTASPLTFSMTQA